MVTRADEAPLLADSSRGTRKVVSSPAGAPEGREGEGLDGDGATATVLLPLPDELLNIEPTAKPTTPPTMRAMMTEGFMSAWTPLGGVNARVL